LQLTIKPGLAHAIPALQVARALNHPTSLDSAGHISVRSSWCQSSHWVDILWPHASLGCHARLSLCYSL